MNTVEKVAGRAVRCIVSSRQADDPAVLIGSSQKAEKVIGLRPKYTLEQNIEAAWK